MRSHPSRTAIISSPRPLYAIHRKPGTFTRTNSNPCNFPTVSLSLYIYITTHCIFIFGAATSHIHQIHCNPSSSLWGYPSYISRGRKGQQEIRSPCFASGNRQIAKLSWRPRERHSQRHGHSEREGRRRHRERCR